MRYGKRTRDQAAWIASVGASNRFSCEAGTGCHSALDSAADYVGGLNGRAYALYWAAWSRVHRIMGLDCLDPLLDAEAEALIRTGWSP